MEIVEGSSGHRIHFLEVVRGLESERAVVKKAVAESSPDLIAVSISPEELEALKKYDGEDVPPSNYEEDVYMDGLSRFGDVKKPPPCFVEACDVASERGLRLEALDLDNEEFTEAYVTSVSTFEMMSTSLREAKLRRKNFAAKTPREFVLEFDAAVNAREGFKRLEAAREAHMAKRLTELAASHVSSLAIVELERAAGVRRLLDDYRLMY